MWYCDILTFHHNYQSNKSISWRSGCDFPMWHCDIVILWYSVITLKAIQKLFSAKVCYFIMWHCDIVIFHQIMKYHIGCDPVILWYSVKSIKASEKFSEPMHVIEWCDIVILWYSIISIRGINHFPEEVSMIFLKWYCDIVILWYSVITLKQYKQYCDIRLKLLEQKGNILGKVLYFYVILWYCDILTKELWPNITISHWMWYCDILSKWF